MFFHHLRSRHAVSNLTVRLIDQPLLRGFGRHIVREPLIQAERDVRYQVHNYERFRRTYAVDVSERVYRVQQSLDQLKNVPVFTAGGPVPLGALADFELVAGPQSIERENHRAKVTITANVGKPEMSFMAMGLVNHGTG